MTDDAKVKVRTAQRCPELIKGLREAKNPYTTDATAILRKRYKPAAEDLREARLDDDRTVKEDLFTMDRAVRLATRSLEPEVFETFSAIAQVVKGCIKKRARA